MLFRSEKTGKAAAERESDRHYYQMQGEITGSLNQMIAAHEVSKQQLLFANAAENKALAESKKLALEEDKMATAEANVAEINSNLNSLFLTEDPSTTVSHANPNRPIPYHFKGLPTEYKQYILDTQMQQANQAYQMKAAAKSDTEAWDAYMRHQNVEASKMELAVNRERQSQRLQLKSDLKQQAEEIKAREAAAFADLTSMPSAEYFAQFGTSSR